MAILTPVARVKRIKRFVRYGLAFLERLCRPTETLDVIHVVDLFWEYLACDWVNVALDRFAGNEHVRAFGRRFPSYHYAVAALAVEALGILALLGQRGEFPDADANDECTPMPKHPFPSNFMLDSARGIEIVSNTPHGRERLTARICAGIAPAKNGRNKFFLTLGELDFCETSLPLEYERALDRARRVPRPHSPIRAPKPAIDFSQTTWRDAQDAIVALAQDVRLAAESERMPFASQVRQLRAALECVKRGAAEFENKGSSDILEWMKWSGLYGSVDAAVSELASTLEIELGDDDEAWNAAIDAAVPDGQAVAPLLNAGASQAPPNLLTRTQREPAAGELKMPMISFATAQRAARDGGAKAVTMHDVSVAWKSLSAVEGESPANDGRSDAALQADAACEPPRTLVDDLVDAWFAWQEKYPQATETKKAKMAACVAAFRKHHKGKGRWKDTEPTVEMLKNRLKYRKRRNAQHHGLNGG